MKDDDEKVTLSDTQLGCLVIIGIFFVVVVFTCIMNLKGDNSSSTTETTTAVKQEAKTTAPAPLVPQKLFVSKDEYGNPNAYLIVKNTSQKTVDAFKTTIYVQNAFGEGLNKTGNPIDPAIDRTMQGFTIAPNETHKVSYVLPGYVDGVTFTLFIDAVHFTDGTRLDTSSNQSVKIESKSAN